MYCRQEEKENGVCHRGKHDLLPNMVVKTTGLYKAYSRNLVEVKNQWVSIKLQNNVANKSQFTVFRISSV